MAPRGNLALAERPFAVDRRGTTIQAGDLVIYSGQMRRVASVDAVRCGTVSIADSAGAATSVPTSEVELVI
jgi:uncharacterized protein (DUF39 family)